MRPDRKIECPECKKIIGEYILKSVVGSPLGSIPCYDGKIDRRKASRIGIGKGPLCKKCAKRIFPDGVAYKVQIWYVNGWMNANCGINHTGLFSKKEGAAEAVKDMNRRCADNHARIEEVKI